MSQPFRDRSHDAMTIYRFVARRKADPPDWVVAIKPPGRGDVKQFSDTLHLVQVRTRPLTRTQLLLKIEQGLLAHTDEALARPVEIDDDRQHQRDRQ
jgi:hypothetical protein